VTATALVGGTLIDGTGAPARPDAAVVVRDGRVEWVGEAAALDGNGDLRRVDVAGKHVIPGLMDANVHLVLDTDPAVLLRYDPGCYDELVVEAAQVALRAGLTTVFDTWGPLEPLRRVRDRIDSGEVVGSRVFFAGNIMGNGGPWSEDFSAVFGETLNADTVANVNRHWTHGVGDELTWMPAGDVRRVVREYIATSGIDFVKYASSAHAFLRFIALSPDSQRAIVEEAHAAGMTAQACSLAPEALKLAIEAGVDLLQHGSSTGRHPMPQETLELIVERQLPCVLLLRTERRIEAVRVEEDLPQPVRDLMTYADGNNRRLIEAGAKLLLATDGGIFSPRVAKSGRKLIAAMFRLPDVSVDLGRSHLLWFQAAIERSMAPMDALLAATRNIAEAYGKLDELGTVEPGKRADLVVLDGDPLADVASFGRIAHVMKDGELVDRERLPERPVLTVEG